MKVKLLYCLSIMFFLNVISFVYFKIQQLNLQVGLKYEDYNAKLINHRIEFIETCLNASFYIFVFIFSLLIGFMIYRIVNRVKLLKNFDRD